MLYSPYLETRAHRADGKGAMIASAVHTGPRDHFALESVCDTRLAQRWMAS